MNTCTFCNRSLGPDDVRVVVIDPIHVTETRLHLTCSLDYLPVLLNGFPPENGGVHDYASDAVTNRRDDRLWGTD